MIILLLLFAAAFAQQPTDVNSAIGVYLNFTLSWVITDRNSLIINIISKQPGYFALMYSQSMTNSDLTAVQFLNGTGLIRDYFSVNHSRPTIYPRNSVNALQLSTDGASYVQARFERPFITNNPRDNVLRDGADVKFALVWNSNTPTISFHGKNIAYISGTLLNNTLINISADKN